MCTYRVRFVGEPISLVIKANNFSEAMALVSVFNKNIQSLVRN